MNVIKQILMFVFSLQEKFLTARLDKTLGVKNKSRRKKIYGNGVLLSLDSLADAEREKLEEECKLILKSAKYDPLAALEYIKGRGTTVHFIDNAKYLNAIGENEGFIYPQHGTKALYISLLIKSKPSIKTNEMFILSKGEINKYIFIYHFYNWFMFKHNISGVGTEEAELLDKYLFGESDINKLQLTDIYKLKDAIAQDKAAIDFVIKLCKEYDGAKNAAEKLKTDGANL